MAKLERANPIPAGTYWVDVIDPSTLDPEHWKAFQFWVDQHGVEVLKRDRKITGSPMDWVRGERSWVLFRVTKPTPRWPKSLPIGFPTVASAKTTQAATSQRPPEQTVEEYWGLPKMSMPSAGAALALLLGLWLMKK